MKTTIIYVILILATLTVSAKKKKDIVTHVQYGLNNSGTKLSIQFDKGKEHNYPLFAIWLADESGKFIQTLYVSESIGKGVFRRVDKKGGIWNPGFIQRPAALPYWAHQRGVLNEFGTYNPTPLEPEIDAYTGATPQNSFVLDVVTEKLLNGKYKVFMELNQTWDWNEYWTNDLHLDDADYKTSSQPALVYAVDINTAAMGEKYTMKPIGHSHYSGQDGSLTTDLSTITTALKIAKKIQVEIIK